MKSIKRFNLIRFIKSACLYVGAVLLLAGCVDFDALFGSRYPLVGGDGLLTVSFLDVGQADCTLISLPDGKHVLIDGGNAQDGELIADYLDVQGIDTIDLLVATHPHEDHIGGLDDVLTAVDVLMVYMPELSEGDTPTTKTYERFLDAVINENCDVLPATVGEIVLAGDDYTITCLSPSRTAIGDLNNYSVVLKLCYKDSSFIFMGDAEMEIEEELLQTEFDLAADVIKVGHHGSNSSSGKDFVIEVMPEYAVISCGTGNTYGHPHKETVLNYNMTGTALYRTDTMGTIHIKTDGTAYEIINDTNTSLDGNKK